MNTVIITGRLTRDVNFTPGTEGRKARAFFTVASNRTGKDAGADFIAMTAFGRQAELLNEHVGRGHLVGVTGHLHTSSYEQDGETQYRQEVIADSVDFLARPSGQD